jgi:TonB family protein
MDRSLALEEKGLVQADIYVDERGKQRACYIIVSSGSDLLDTQTCAAAMQKGKFVAAHSSDGSPMPGIYSFRAQWRLEEGRPVPSPPDVTLEVARLPNGLKSAGVRLRYIVDEAGKIVQCEVEVSSGVPALDAAACRAMPGRYTFSPARDPGGVAHRVVRTQSVGFQTPK